MLDWVPDPIRDLLWSVKHGCLSSAHRHGLVEYMQAALEAQLDGGGINLVLDVGANRGQYARLIRRLGYSGDMLSFEPIPENVRILARQAGARPNWTIVPLALGDCEEVRPFNVMVTTEFSSFAMPSGYGREMFPDEMKVARTDLVSVRRLDGILPGLIPDCQSRAIHLKVDTQGHDLQVIRGLGRLVESVRSLQVEVSFRTIYEREAKAWEVLPAIEELGFGLVGIWPVARERSLRIIDADCLFVRG